MEKIGYMDAEIHIELIFRMPKMPNIHKNPRIPFYAYESCSDEFAMCFVIYSVPEI